MRLVSAVALFGFCQGAWATPAPVACGPEAPADAHDYDPGKFVELAGSYRLVAYDTVTELRSSADARLDLWPNDSAARVQPLWPQSERERRERVLGGSLATVRASGERYVEPAEVEAMVLYVGRRGPFQLGGPTRYTIRKVHVHGFWGEWQADMDGIAMVDSAGRIIAAPEPGGYFCAFRTDA